MLILLLNGLNLQILNWLSHYPTDMESYIRPGCVILTIYLHLPNWMWDEVVLHYINSEFRSVYVFFIVYDAEAKCLLLFFFSIIV
jgi:hypothetical protein